MKMKEIIKLEHTGHTEDVTKLCNHIRLCCVKKADNFFTQWDEWEIICDECCRVFHVMYEASK